MTCREVEDLVEAVAAGDLSADAAFRAHVETCVTCAAALASAVAIEAALAARPAPAAPVRFDRAVAARIRHERWRAEQQVDRAFNAFVIVGVLAMAAGALALFNLASVAAAIATAAGTLSTALSQPVSRSAEQALPLWAYGLGCALLGTSVLVWRWAENPKTER